MKPRRWKVAVLNSHPIQYFAPLYRHLTESGEFEIVALYASDFSLRGARDPGFGQAVVWDVDLLKGYKAVFLGDRAKRRTPGGFWSLVCPELWSEIRNGDYDALWLHGHSYAMCLLALIAAKSCGVRVFMRGETHLGLQRSRLKAAIRTPIMNLLYRLCDGCLAIGTANHEFYRAMGVPERKIELVPYTVDNRRFIDQSTISSAERARILGQFGLPEELPVILYASKFQRRKHPDDVLRAAAVLQERYGLSVLMVGSGEMEKDLMQLSAQLGLEHIAFAGFLNQSELPKIYGSCDIFVLPSENEPWGLIVNEVMCAGRPVVVAGGVGCAADLVSEGLNGFLCEAADVDSLVRALEPLLANPDLRNQLGKASLEKIGRWGYEECRSGLKAALLKTVSVN